MKIHKFVKILFTSKALDGIYSHVECGKEFHPLFSDDTSSNKWKNVTCRRCLKLKRLERNRKTSK